MKSRPIIMRADEVCAIIDGRKTQFRRPVKWPVLSTCDGSKRRVYTEQDVVEMNKLLESRQRHPSHQFCPHGQPGDRLWVRETWADVRKMGFDKDLFPLGAGYRADCKSVASLEIAKGYGVRWRPSVHMPRWASRITLEIVRVRVERVQEISDQDAIHEGIERSQGAWASYDKIMNRYMGASNSFRSLWQSTHGTWDANPWVWVVEFRRVEK